MLARHPALFAPPHLHLLIFESMVAYERQRARNGCPLFRPGLSQALEVAGLTPATVIQPVDTVSSFESNWSAASTVGVRMQNKA
jgi:hypothetical protein